MKIETLLLLPPIEYIILLVACELHQYLNYLHFSFLKQPKVCLEALNFWTLVESLWEIYVILEEKQNHKQTLKNNQNRQRHRAKKP